MSAVEYVYPAIDHAEVVNNGLADACRTFHDIAQLLDGSAS